MVYVQNFWPSAFLVDWLHNYLSGRSIDVVMSGQASNNVSINASVPQGSILGPLLFSVFIDDLVTLCDNELYLYADDSTLFAPIKTSVNSKTVAASLNRDLSNMNEWARQLLDNALILEYLSIWPTPDNMAAIL